MNAQQEQIEVQDQEYRRKQLELKMNEKGFKAMQESVKAAENTLQDQLLALVDVYDLAGEDFAGQYEHLKRL